MRQRQTLAEVLHRLAGQTAQVLNIAALGSGLQTERRTIETYVRLLEELFLVTRLPAWGKTLMARATRSPKIHVIDSGLAARLLRVSQSKLGRLDPTVPTEFGHLLETFVVGELRDTLGSRFVADIALSLGSRSYTYDDRLHVLPVDRLWRANA